MAGNLELEVMENPSHTTRTLTYHETKPAGSQVKMEFGEDELDELVPAGKTWTIQASLVITETDA